MIVWIVVGVVSLLSFLIPARESRDVPKPVFNPAGFETQEQPVISEFEVVRK